MGERQAVNTSALLIEAEHRLRSLSPERLRVANDFLAYLQEREEDQATAELLAFLAFGQPFDAPLSKLTAVMLCALRISAAMYEVWLTSDAQRLLNH